MITDLCKILQILRMIQHFSKEGTFSSRLSFLCNCCILMQFNHQPITAIDLNFLHGVADTALLLLPSYCKLCGMLLLLVLQVLQVVQIEHCPGGEPALHCSLSSSQLICLATGLGKAAGRRKVLRAVFCPIFCCSAAPQCSQGKMPQAR